MSKSKFVNQSRKGSRFASEDEDPKSLQAIANRSARSAYHENKTLGLPVTYISRGKVIRETPDGKKHVLDTLPRSSAPSVSKGTVIRVKRD